MSDWGNKTDGSEVIAALKEHVVGKTVAITGVADGTLGGECALTIASGSPRLLILSHRNESKLQTIVEKIKTDHPSVQIQVLIMDLGSFKSVRKAAAEVTEKIDVLINNAGIMASPWGKTEDGFEQQFGVGHLGHFLFTNLLLKEGKINGGGRIVNVSSIGHKRAPVRFEDYNFNDGKDYDPWQAYGQAKSANVLFSKALATRLQGKNITSYSLHPGGIRTTLGRHMSQDDWQMVEKMMKDRNEDMKTLQQGVATHCVAAFDPRISEQNGAYLVDCQVSNDTADWIMESDGPEKLWRLSEKCVGETFDV